MAVVEGIQNKRTYVVADKVLKFQCFVRGKTVLLEHVQPLLDALLCHHVQHPDVDHCIDPESLRKEIRRYGLFRLCSRLPRTTKTGAYNSYSFDYLFFTHKASRIYSCFLQFMCIVFCVIGNDCSFIGMD